MSLDGNSSFLKLNYLLRPSKQVERKLIIEAIHRLGPLGYDISEYEYVGLGSIYYADFLLFHKYLFIDGMICAESANIPKRMTFNRPYEFIELHMNEVADVIPMLKRDRKYFVWLDYDVALSSSVLNDIKGMLSILAYGSLLVVTVDAEPRLEENAEADQLTGEQRVELWVDRLKSELGAYETGPIDRRVFTRAELPRFYCRVLRTIFRESVTYREGLGYLQLFNYTYADNAQMLTVGGLIGDDAQLASIRSSDLLKQDYLSEAEESIRISVPHLTMREKHWLDQHMDTSPEDLVFELGEEHLQNFRRYFGHYPTYFESVI